MINYSDELKRLLVISAKDWLDNKDNPKYIEKLNNMSIAKLREEGYIKLEPKVRLPEHEQVKAYIIISFDNTKTPKHVGTIINNNDDIELFNFSS